MVGGLEVEQVRAQPINILLIFVELVHAVGEHMHGEAEAVFQFFCQLELCEQRLDVFN